MNRLATAFALSLVVVASIARAQAPVEPLEGLDPVLLVEGKEAQGDPKLFVDRDGFRYSFASPETKARFEREPEAFEIQLHGLCARMGDTTLGNPDLYLVHEGRIYLFGSPQCRDLFHAAPQRFLEGPPPAPLTESTDAAALKRGRQLVEKAVEALGGAVALDSLERFEVSARQAAEAGAAALASSWTYRFPDRARLEEGRPFGTLTWVTTVDGAFSTFNGQAFPLNDVQAANVRQRLARNVVSLLKARREPGFVAASIGPGRAGEVAVERVAVTHGGVAATLGIDPKTGTVLSLSYRERFDDGAWGDVVETYSDFRSAGGDFRSAEGDFRSAEGDFRPTGGLMLPFRVSTTWNGQPWPRHTLTVEAIAVNRELPAGIFDRPGAP